MPVPTATAFSTRPVASYAAFDRLYLKAIRYWVLLARAGRSPRQPLAALLGERLAAQFCLLMEDCVSVWPDPFTTFPPCACQCSPDEAALLGLLAHCDANAPEAAHAMLRDMLSPAARERLWDAAARCGAERLGE